MKKGKLGCLGIVGIIIIVGAIWSFFDGIGKPEVPDVEGKSITKAETVLKNAGFTNITYEDEIGNDLAGMDLDGWTVTGQSPSGETKASEDEEILLTCQSPAAAEADKQKAALEKKLDSVSAWTAVQLYGESEYPYGFDLHTALGVIAEEPSDDNTWFLKATCDVTNAYGTEAEMTCEAHVTGTSDSPVIVDFTVY